MHNKYVSRQTSQRFSGQIVNKSQTNIKQFPYITLPLAKGRKCNIPDKAHPLFCTFDKSITEHIHKVGGVCIFLKSRIISAYDFKFCHNKDVWIFHLADEVGELERRFAYALLRHHASKVQIQSFPLEGQRHG